MTDLITVTGVVGNDPRHTVTPAGLPITNFRLASTRRYFDRSTGQWTDGETNWYTVSTFRQLALNAAESIRKGQRVVVHGRLRVRAWQTEEKSGTAIEIEAESLGHDLTWGVAQYAKRSVAKPAEVPEGDPADAPHAGGTSLAAVEDAWAVPGNGWDATATVTGEPLGGDDRDERDDRDDRDDAGEHVDSSEVEEVEAERMLV
ncbi:single-stranded DNA-binding protein [Agromyces aurantiacus]|uniref:Single-stranded DNA-binding protein n=1 Tax=Agromyces aurantiacus TaxID=165814 RepID=A0ABV9R7I9_9MICO|nr:single-stranded DNA-binding protein [Agromyces aurantiacus]MBM7504991.1 single-strand DNA-binding protein [Agromyces aurantiacus]